MRKKKVGREQAEKKQTASVENFIHVKMFRDIILKIGYLNRNMIARIIPCVYVHGYGGLRSDLLFFTL